MSEPRSRQAVTLLLVFAAVAFGMVLAGGFDLTPTGLAAPEPAAVPVPRAGAMPIQALPSFADLAEAVLPAVVSIDAVTIERGRGGRSPRGVDPFEFFFGPRRQRPDGQGGPGEEPEEPEEFRSDSGGSGFVISADGLIVTNNHVVEGATRLRVHLGDRFFPAEVKGTDPATDIALIKIDAGRDLVHLRLGDSDSVRVGDWVVAIGNPLLLEQTVTVGVVSAKGRQIGINDRSFENFIQTDAAINRGNSGGPLVDLAGQVVGIATAMNWGAENIGFAVPVNTLKVVLPQLREKGRVSRGYLGVTVGEIDHETAEAFGLESQEGALVATVEEGTPSEKAGVEHGDIIVAVDGRKVARTRDLIDYVSAKGPGVKVTLSIVRDGQRLEKTVELGERPGLGAAVEDAEEDGAGGIEWLGLEYQELTPTLRGNHGIPASVEGVFVGDVAASSPLFEEGVRPGDVITEVNGRAAEGVEVFERLVEGAPSGSFLRLYVRRFDPRGGRGGAFFAIVRIP
jgi:serine protease Do